MLSRVSSQRSVFAISHSMRMMSTHRTGTVKWFNERKGFGFLKPEHGDKDVFFHYSSIRTDAPFKTVVDGDKVTYATEASARGDQATDVWPEGQEPTQ